LFRGLRTRSVLTGNFAGEESEMADESRSRLRYGEDFWRAHHEAWRRSDLNQREYCEAQDIPLKAFGNWRAKFKAEPQPQARKLLYRRGRLSHSLSHTLSHPLSHVTYPSSSPPGPIVPPARDGHRRRFCEADRRRIVEEAAQPDANLAKTARRYGIARRVLCRWKQELAPATAPVFVAVQITDAQAPRDGRRSDEERAP
jgi:transposase-like protein